MKLKLLPPPAEQVVYFSAIQKSRRNRFLVPPAVITESTDYLPLTTSFKAFPALNFGDLEASIVMVSPV